MTTVDIKRYALLKKLLKGLTAKHVAKNADIFTADEVGKLMNKNS